MRLVLASASPARLLTLQRAGMRPEVIVSGVDESGVRAPDTAALVRELARRKASAVAARVGPAAVVIGCDSLLDVDGIGPDGLGLGKPVDADDARARWHAMAGRSATLHTGHVVIDTDPLPGRPRQLEQVATTTVHFAAVDAATIDAYVATGEPLQVAGAFTIDGLGGWFVEAIEGDHHNVVGISLPTLRRMFAELGRPVTELGW